MSVGIDRISVVMESSEGESIKLTLLLCVGGGGGDEESFLLITTSGDGEV